MKFATELMGGQMQHAENLLDELRSMNCNLLSLSFESEICELKGDLAGAVKSLLELEKLLPAQTESVPALRRFLDLLLRLGQFHEGHRVASKLNALQSNHFSPHWMSKLEELSNASNAQKLIFLPSRETSITSITHCAKLFVPLSYQVGFRQWKRINCHGVRFSAEDVREVLDWYAKREGGVELSAPTIGEFLLAEGRSPAEAQEHVVFQNEDVPASSFFLHLRLLNANGATKVLPILTISTSPLVCARVSGIENEIKRNVMPWAEHVLEKATKALSYLVNERLAGANL